MFFLALAAFLLTNKVWSPQYVIWLVPLAVLARPRLGAYALWQLAEIGYFLAIWWYLLTIPGMSTGTGFHGIGQGWYFTALLARFATTALLAGLVVRDIVHPDGDVVRADGEDDPGEVSSRAPPTRSCCAAHAAPPSWSKRKPGDRPRQPGWACLPGEAHDAPGGMPRTLAECDPESRQALDGAPRSSRLDTHGETVERLRMRNCGGCS